MDDVHAVGHGALLRGISLSIAAGEIVAIAGVAGNGQGALAEVLFGLLRTHAGRVQLNGGRTAAHRARSWPAVSRGCRKTAARRAVVGDLPLWENAVLERLRSPASHGGRAAPGGDEALHRRTDPRLRRARPAGRWARRRRRRGRRAPAVRRQHAEADPRPRAVHAGAHHAPRLIVADQPTWGLDVGAVASVHRLRDACCRRDAVLL
jgi:general nucleoside transport system ATP-binding protein